MNDLRPFDASGEPKPENEREPLSHQGDPQTSIEAARDFAQSGKCETHRQMCLEAVRRCPGGTHSEIATVTALDWLQVARRLPELERAGLVRKGEPRTCAVKGSKCCTWWLKEGDRL